MHPDTPPPLDELRLALSKATEGGRRLPWKVWTSNSHRRIKTDYSEVDRDDGRDVLDAYRCRDGCLDLTMPEDQLIALVECINALPQLLDLAALGLLVREGGKEVLRPFAEAAECLDNPNPDNMEIWEHSAAMCITAGDLRRARKFLRTLETLAYG